MGIQEDIQTQMIFWIKKTCELGYRRIILAGHSFGCCKVLYYYYTKRANVSGIIFASAPDMQGLTRMYEPDYDLLLEETERNIRDGNPRKLTSKLVENYMPFSSATFYNCYKTGSNADNFPIIRNPKHFEQLETVDIPVLAFSGEDEEVSYLQLDLLQKKARGCPDFTWKVIENTNHIYFGKEDETAKLIFDWLERFKDSK